MEPHDVIVITNSTYPSLFAAFEMISHDCGRQAGHENYAVPIDWADKGSSRSDAELKLSEIDLQLLRLLRDADGDFECLCIGDVDESDRIVRDYGLQDASELLQRFFEEFA